MGLGLIGASGLRELQIKPGTDTAFRNRLGIKGMEQKVPVPNGNPGSNTVSVPGFPVPRFSASTPSIRTYLGLIKLKFPTH